MYGRDNWTQRSGGGMGFGFRGSSPPFPYTGRGRGGLPRCRYPGLTASFRDTALPAYGYAVNNPQDTAALKKQAEELKQALQKIEARISELEKSGKE